MSTANPRNSDSSAKNTVCTASRQAHRPIGNGAVVVAGAARKLRAIAFVETALRLTGPLATSFCFLDRQREVENARHFDEKAVRSAPCRVRGEGEAGVRRSRLHRSSAGQLLSSCISDRDHGVGCPDHAARGPSVQVRVSGTVGDSDTAATLSRSLGYTVFNTETNQQVRSGTAMIAGDGSYRFNLRLPGGRHAAVPGNSRSSSWPATVQATPAAIPLW